MSIEINGDMRFMRIEAVLSMTTLSRSSLYTMMSTGDFPRPVEIGSSTRAWVEEEVREWMKGKVRERDMEE